MTWVTVAVTVATTAYGAYSKNQVAKKQDSALAQQIRQQSATRDKVAQRQNQFIQSQKGQTDAPQQTAEAKQLQTALAANQGNTVKPLTTLGAVSDAYKKSGANAAQGVTDYGNQYAGLTAAIDAPTQQRRDNMRSINDLGVDTGNINRNQRDADSIASMKIGSIQSNPWLALLAKGAGQYAGAKLGANARGTSIFDGSTAGAGGYVPEDYN